MGQKSTISIEMPLQKTIKKIATLLEISQGEVIAIAIQSLESFLLKNRRIPLVQNQNQIDELDRDMQPYILDTMKKNPDLWNIYLLIQEHTNDLNEILIDNWGNGLEEKGSPHE